MTYYVCFTTGLVDCTPDGQVYREFDTVEALALGCDAAIGEFVEMHTGGDEEETHVTRHRLVDSSMGALRLGNDASMLDARLASFVTGDTLYVLDVVGMTEAEYQRENEE